MTGRPFYELLQSARAYGAPVYGLDCRPRGDIRKIAVRDRHAAQKIAEHSGAASRRANHRAVWRIASGAVAPAGRVRFPIAARTHFDGAAKSRRLVLEGGGRAQGTGARQFECRIMLFASSMRRRWRNTRAIASIWSAGAASVPAPDDLAPVYYNLIEALLRFLGIDKYKATGAAPAIVDCLPEVHSRRSAGEPSETAAPKGVRRCAEMEATLEKHPRTRLLRMCRALMLYSPSG